MAVFFCHFAYVPPHPSPLPQGEGASVSVLCCGDPSAGRTWTQKLLAVLGRRKGKLLTKVVAQRRRLSKTGLFSDAVDAHPTAFQVIFCSQQTLIDQPARRCRSRCRLEATKEGTLAHAHPTRQRVDAVRFNEMVVQEIKQLSQTLALP